MRAMEIKVSQVEDGKRKAKPTDEANLGFGQVFSDHIFSMDYDSDKGWYDARIEPYHSLTLDPACMVLHYVGNGYISFWWYTPFASFMQYTMLMLIFYIGVIPTILSILWIRYATRSEFLASQFHPV